eukprot:gene21506-biopygen7409
MTMNFGTNQAIILSYPLTFCDRIIWHGKRFFVIEVPLSDEQFRVCCVASNSLLFFEEIKGFHGAVDLDASLACAHSGAHESLQPTTFTVVHPLTVGERTLCDSHTTFPLILLISIITNIDTSDPFMYIHLTRTNEGASDNHV